MGYLNGPLPIAFAHRGGSMYPENSLAAFQYCADLGYRYLETDVRLSADGVVVVAHDATTDRLLGRPGRIADLPWRQLAVRSDDGTPLIPRLDDVLTTWPLMNLNIDAKSAEVVGPLAEVINRHDARSRICVTSFADGRIARLRSLLGPGTVSGVGRVGVGLLRAASYAGRRGMLLRVPGNCVQVPVAVRGQVLVDARFVELVHSLGKQIHVWTINDPDDMARLLDLGVDGIMTDQPALLRDVMRRRGVWPQGSESDSDPFTSP